MKKGLLCLFHRLFCRPMREEALQIESKLRQVFGGETESNPFGGRKERLL